MKTLNKTVRVQAYFAGKGPTRTIVLNDALLKELTTPEILAVVGHEAGHVHERRWLGQLGSTLGLLAFLYVIELIFRVVARRQWWGVTTRADVRTLPLIFIVFWFATTVIAPVSAAIPSARKVLRLTIGHHRRNGKKRGSQIRPRAEYEGFNGVGRVP